MTAGVKSSRVLDELEEVRRQNGGTLPAAAVVDYARNPNTALHRRFTWDDTRAAELYRLEQARRIIRVHVSVIDSGHPETTVRVFSRLASDAPSVGYRHTVQVMDDATQRAELLAMAIAELNRVRKKYEALSELAAVWGAIDNVHATAGRET